MRSATIGLAFGVVAYLLATSPATAQSLPLPTPHFLLVGVIIPEAGEPKAVMEDPKTHEQEIYALGAQIGDARLTKILKEDRVVLTSGDIAIEVRLAGPAPPPPPSRAIPFRPAPGRARRVVPR
jgi:hypothetical protein